MSPRHHTAIGLLVAIAACTSPDSPRASVLALLTEHERVAEVGSTMPIVVRVTDDIGRGVEGITVRFRSSGAGDGFSPGAVAPTAARTDADAVVRVEWTLGTGAGGHVLRAWIGDEAAPIDQIQIAATAVPGVAATFRPSSHGAAAVTVGDSTLVGVTPHDRYGNPTTRHGQILWRVHDPSVAEISRTRLEGHEYAAVIIGRSEGATAVDVTEPSVGTSRFDLRAYDGIGREMVLEASPFRIVILGVDGSPRVTFPVAGSSPAWSPDGQQIVYRKEITRPHRLYVINVDGSGERVIAGPPEHESPSQPAWSPDGERIAFIASRSEPGAAPRRGLFVVDAGGASPAREIIPPCDVSDGTTCSGPVRPAWSPDGARILFGGLSSTSDCQGTRFFVANADGSGVRAILVRDVSAGSPQWSPDGSRIAFTGRRIHGPDCSTGQDLDVYVANVDGSGVTALTNSAMTGASFSPTWSPDTRIAFISHSEFGPSLNIMNSDGSEARRVATGEIRQVRWKP